MKVYTKGGDKGRTSLVGGARIAKSDLRLEAYGTLDELTADLGYLCDLYLRDGVYVAQMVQIVSRVMDTAGVLATPIGVACGCAIEDRHIEQIEGWIDALGEGLPELRNFTLPVGCAAMSYANVCRTVCRRAERAVVRVAELGDEQRVATAQIYINRLSDYLYLLGRRLALDSGAEEILWSAGLEMPKK